MVSANAMPTKHKHRMVLIKNIVRSTVWPKYWIFRCCGFDEERFDNPMKFTDGLIIIISNAININRISMIPYRTPSAPNAKKLFASGCAFFRFQLDILAVDFWEEKGLIKRCPRDWIEWNQPDFDSNLNNLHQWSPNQALELICLAQVLSQQK